MKIRKLVFGRSAAFFIYWGCIAFAAYSQSGAAGMGFLLDDFSSPVSRLGNTWQGFTDRVMGGRSDMRVGIEYEDGRPHLVMAGNVSLANNGGFIQARLLLSQNGPATFDASRYSGVKLTVRGIGSAYYIFLRTSGNKLPWSFFMAPLPVTEAWSEVAIPWNKFTKGDFGSFFDLNVRKLTSIAVVAYKKEFAAELRVREISFY